MRKNVAQYLCEAIVCSGGDAALIIPTNRGSDDWTVDTTNNVHDIPAFLVQHAFNHQDSEYIKDFNDDEMLELQSFVVTLFGGVWTFS